MFTQLHTTGWVEPCGAESSARETGQWDVGCSTLSIAGHPPATSHHTHLCAWLVFLQPLNAGQRTSSKLCIRSQYLPGVPSHTHTHIPVLPGCPSCTDQLITLPSVGATCVTCVLDQQGHSLHLACLALTEGKSKFPAIFLGPSLKTSSSTLTWPLHPIALVLNSL